MTRKEWSEAVTQARIYWCAMNALKFNAQGNSRLQRQIFEARFPLLRRGWLVLPTCMVPQDNLPDGTGLPSDDAPLAGVDHMLKTCVEDFDPAACVPYMTTPTTDLVPDVTNPDRFLVLARDPAHDPTRRRFDCPHAAINRAYWPAFRTCTQIWQTRDGMLLGVASGVVRAIVMPLVLWTKFKPVESTP